jgi:hypothetical protein
MSVVVVAAALPSGTGTNCPHPNHIMTDFFIKTIVPTMPRSSPGSERVVSGSSQEDQTAAGSETANDTVSSRGASCCTMLLVVAVAAAVPDSAILLSLLLTRLLVYETVVLVLSQTGKSIVSLSHHCEDGCAMMGEVYARKKNLK